jgi:YVTN family beta-propeller protein
MVVATVTVGSSPFGVAITPDGTRAYVTNHSGTVISGTVSVIDTASNTVAATVPVGSGPLGVAITPDGKHVYVADNHPPPLGPGMSVIDTTTNTVVAIVPVAPGSVDVAIGPPGACGPGDAVLVNKQFPAAGELTYDVLSPTRILHSISVIGASNKGSFTLPTVSSDGHSATGGVFIKANPNESASFELDAAFVSPAFACTTGFVVPVTFAGTPGRPNCFGKSVSALARQYGGLPAAAAALGFSSVQALQEAIRAFCSG